MRSTLTRFGLVAYIIAIAMAALIPTGAVAANDLPAACNNNPVTAPEFQTWSKKVWNRDHWERKRPSQKILDAKAHKIHCAAGPGHVASMRARWSKDETSFYKFRRAALWRATYRQFKYPDGKHWAVPYPIAWCESGGDYYVGPAGAYGLIMAPSYMTPKEQDEVAYRLYVEHGEEPWRPYESECMYR